MHGVTQDFAYQLMSGYWTWKGQPPHKMPGIDISYNDDGLSGHRQALFDQAASVISGATGLHLSRVHGSAQITIDDPLSGVASTNPPSYLTFGQRPEIVQSVVVNFAEDWNGGSDDANTLSNAEHELLHAVGLGHSGNYIVADGGGVIFDNDTSAMSIMSYYGSPAPSPRAADIAAVQQLYGLIPMPPHWSQSVSVGSYPSNATPLAGADFNADGTADVAWFDPSTNSVDIWMLSGSHWAASVAVGSHPAGSSASVVGDFNGDGTGDIGWYNPSTSDFEFWALSNGHWAGSTDIGGHPAGYVPVASGDFDHNGTSDIVWYNQSSGNVDVWELSAGGHWQASLNIGSNPGWVPFAASDYNHDGYADITWINPGDNSVQTMGVTFAQHPMGSTPVGSGDFDHNGTPDIAWYNPSSHGLETWLLAPTSL